MICKRMGCAETEGLLILEGCGDVQDEAGFAEFKKYSEIRANSSTENTSTDTAKKATPLDLATV